jgi:integrase
VFGSSLISKGVAYLHNEPKEGTRPPRELLRLEWSDVDMQRREFTLQHTKNGESRTVPMPPDVYQVFTGLWQERRLTPSECFCARECQ